MSTVNLSTLTNFTKKFEKMCNTLTDECQHSDMESLHASCLFIGKKILSTSHNFNGRTRLSGMNFPSIHAEVGALTKFYGQKFKKRLLCKNKSSLSVPSKNYKESTVVRNQRFERCSGNKGKVSQCILCS